MNALTSLFHANSNKNKKHPKWPSTIELLTLTKVNHYCLLCTHVWSYPVYVLDPKLQDGHNFSSGIVDHVKANFWFFAILILLLWSISATFVLLQFTTISHRLWWLVQDCIWQRQWYLDLMIFAIASLTLIETCCSMMMSLVTIELKELSYQKSNP